MKEQIKLFFSLFSILVVLAFILFVINQVYQLYTLASEISPLFGNLVLWGLIIVFSLLFAIPAVIYFRLPPPLTPPDQEDEIDRFHTQFRKRLSKNKLIRELGLNMEDNADRLKATAILDERADQVIRNTAKSIFMTTAISQNGKLDALTVFVSQTKMIWDIAHIYTQRPTLRDLVNLYSNVGVSTFLATEIEDLDISRQVEPVIKSMFKGSAGQTIPIIGPAASVVMDSLLEGTTNAFLTLRVGVITRNYCSTEDILNMKAVKKAAYAEASTMLGGLVIQTSGQVISAIVKAMKKAGVDKIKASWGAVGRAAESAKTGLGRLSEKMNPFKPQNPQTGLQAGEEDSSES